MSEKRVRVVVRGTVQGVGFRASCARQANALGVTGWVRNRADGSVEIVAEGPRQSLEALVAFARRGPPGACVDHVEVYWLPAQGQFGLFEVA